MPQFPSNHEEFMKAIQNHLKEREGCPVILLVHTPAGLEIQANFMDYALQTGVLDIARTSTLLAFERQAREGFKSGENQIMVSNIKDASNPNKKKVN